MDDFIDGLPKAELHLHIEGTLEPELLFDLARRNGVKIKHDSVEKLREAYAFENLQSFLDIYYEGADVLLHEADFYDLAMAYFRKASSENILHAEVFFDPQTHTCRGVPFKDIIMGLTRAKEDARKELGISVYYIMCFLKHLSEEDAIATFQQSLEFKDLIIGVGLDSTELGNPPAKFQKVIQMSHEVGYRVVSHAGEEGPPEYVRDALDLLKVERIDHGIRSVEDKDLLQRIAKEKIPLTLCPLSNCKLCVIEKMEDFPLKTLLEANVCCTINSDDPSYFGGYIVENYKSITKSLNLSKEDLQLLAKNGFQASFAPDADKQKWVDMVDAYYQKHKAIVG
ncbi:adenosine deaminase [Nitzschia inconspicua]|uniref:Adenosine deaminase n=1 Tax=Nitzschia inconspicua TaxID=303405 RepID=A0A9K3L138_9STRA|nr:adenosine deaminase [Nitzschia inconspicua]